MLRTSIMMIGLVVSSTTIAQTLTKSTQLPSNKTSQKVKQTRAPHQQALKLKQRSTS